MCRRSQCRKEAIVKVVHRCIESIVVFELCVRADSLADGEGGGWDPERLVRQRSRLEGSRRGCCLRRDSKRQQKPREEW